MQREPIETQDHGAAPAGEKYRQSHTPGETGIWVFIMGDMMVFALFFLVFVFYRAENTALFQASQATLNTHYGTFNTLLLLTSSWFVVMATNGVRKNLRRQAATLYGLAFLCGAGFSLIKVVEYREKIQAGFGLTTNDFYMYYYIFTGLHFVHVIIGMAVLVALIHKSLSGLREPGDLALIEGGASYWHMVDVLWIILFPLLYLMK